jgi:hypothetical protein
MAMGSEASVLFEGKLPLKIDLQMGDLEHIEALKRSLEKSKYK